MHKYLIYTFLLVLVGMGQVEAQESGGFYFGIKGGPAIGFQKWNNFQRDPLFRYHAIVFIESATEESVALFAQAGYHVRGSAIRTPAYVNFLGQDINGFTTPFEFRNASLSVGAKQRFDLGINKKFYYMFALRGEYTLSTDLRPDFLEDDDPCGIFYPFEGFVQKFNYGLTVGGGIEFTLSEFVAILTEFTISPDISRQYRQPEVPNVRSCGFGGSSSNQTLGEREITNTTLEISLGFRFLRKVEYIE